MIFLDKKFGRSHAERLGQLLNDHDRRVSRTPLDVANVGAVDAGLMRERLLAPAFRIAKPSQVLSKALPDIHDTPETRPSPMNLQTIRDILVDCPARPSIAVVTYRRQETALNQQSQSSKRWTMRGLAALLAGCACLASTAPATPGDGAKAATALPYAMRDIPLGITLAEYRAIQPFSDNGYLNPRSACDDQAMPSGVRRLEDVPSHDNGLGVVTCQWFSEVPGMSFPMVVRHFIALGEGSGPPSFAFITDGAEQRLFRISFKANEDYYPGIHAALLQKYGAPKVVNDTFLTKAGGQFPNATSTWSNGVSSITLEQRCGRTDRYCLTYRHTKLEKMYDRLIGQVSAAQGAKI